MKEHPGEQSHAPRYISFFCFRVNMVGILAILGRSSFLPARNALVEKVIRNASMSRYIYIRYLSTWHGKSAK